MVCQECKQKPASVHITQIINNDKTKISLCEDCARAYQHQLGFNFEPNFSIHKFLANLLDHEPVVGKPARASGEQCPQCGLTYSQFGQLGRLGCDRCYQVFAGRLEPLLRRIHGGFAHGGKVPRRTGGAIRVKQELRRLKAELQQLVAQEEFERAAKVRDTIRQLEQQLQA